jgi:hypothetical protein
MSTYIIVAMGSESLVPMELVLQEAFIQCALRGWYVALESTPQSLETSKSMPPVSLSMAKELVRATVNHVEQYLHPLRNRVVIDSVVYGVLYGN